MLAKRSPYPWSTKDGAILDSRGIVIARVCGEAEIREKNAVLVRGKEPVGHDFDQQARDELEVNARVLAEAPALLAQARGILVAIDQYMECGLGFHKNKKMRHAALVKIDDAKVGFWASFARIEGKTWSNVPETVRPKRLR